MITTEHGVCTAFELVLVLTKSNTSTSITSPCWHAVNDVISARRLEEQLLYVQNLVIQGSSLCSRVRSSRSNARQCVVFWLWRAQVTRSTWKSTGGGSRSSSSRSTPLRRTSSSRKLRCSASTRRFATLFVSHEY